MAFKYTAKQIYERALSLADLQNSQFITFGDAFHMLNSAYRKVYADSIQIGDLNYIKETELISSGTSLFELPKDFYQLAMMVDHNGNEIDKLPLNASEGDYGYSIQNGTILLQNIKSSVIMKYYPNPDTISFKKDRRDAKVEMNGMPISGFNTVVLTNTGYFYDIATGKSLGTVTYGSPRATLVGRDAWATISGNVGTLYWIGSSVAQESIYNIMLTTSGNFVQNTIDSTYTGFGWCNDDLTARYIINNSNDLCYNDSYLGSANDLMGGNISNARVIYWNGQWCLATLTKIVYPDGSWETTDVPNAKVLLKCDTETGYGYVIPVGSGVFSVVGWTPDTTIDYPNNILFDLTAYDLAIQFRTKQSADAQGLISEYQNLEKTYWKSISSDDVNYSRIRNVRSEYARRWRF